MSRRSMKRYVHKLLLLKPGSERDRYLARWLFSQASAQFASTDTVRSIFRRRPRDRWRSFFRASAAQLRRSI